MTQQAETRTGDRGNSGRLYGKLEERILARDQVGASKVYYDLLRDGRPQSEMLAEAVRIHAPYTHVPYHERIDEGFINFVNNDHCLLSARATVLLSKMVGEGAVTGLPMAQTIWYIPTGLDIWNQKILKAPGHYARAPGVSFTGPPPAPVVAWPDQEPIILEGPLRERLDQWITLVQRGQVIEAYRVFLGLMTDKANRREVLAELVFAGLIDVQDRVFLNRSYTTGHKSFRARATVEVATAVGWEDARNVIYAGALDIAVGPRWYSGYEMACNAVLHFIEQEKISAIPYRGTTAKERQMLANRLPLDAAETRDLIDVLIRQPEPAYMERISQLLHAGKSPRRILDVIQLAAAEIILETRVDTNFSIPQHCYEYCNTLGWFYDNFDHPQRLKLLYVAASYLNRNAWNQQYMRDSQRVAEAAPAGAERLSASQLLDRVEAAILALNGAESAIWTRAYLDNGGEPAAMVRRLALLASRMGNDPHNQEIALCLLEDYGKNQSPGRGILLMAAAHHTGAHRKYGDPLEAARRFGEAMGVSELS
jgi:hypothetical protein